MYDSWLTQHRRAKRKGSTSWRGSGQRAGLWGEEVLIRGYGTWVLQKVLYFKFSIFIFIEKYAQELHLVLSVLNYSKPPHSGACTDVYSFVPIKIKPTEVAVHCFNIWGWRLRVLDSVYNSDYVTTPLLLKRNSLRTTFDECRCALQCVSMSEYDFLCLNGLRLKKKNWSIF